MSHEGVLIDLDPGEGRADAVTTLTPCPRPPSAPFDSISGTDNTVLPQTTTDQSHDTSLAISHDILSSPSPVSSTESLTLPPEGSPFLDELDFEDFEGFLAPATEALGGIHGGDNGVRNGSGSGSGSGSGTGQSGEESVDATTAKLSAEFAGVEETAVHDIVQRHAGNYDDSLQELLRVISDGSVALKSGPAPVRREKPSKSRSERKARQDKIARELKQLRKTMKQQGATKKEIELKIQERLRAPVVDLLLQVANSNSINLMSNPRPGKKLLVLDLDYTLFDYKSEFDTVEELHALKRPFLEEFLCTVYQAYDLVVWSQSTWQRLERVLTSLDVLTKRSYKFVFVLDRSAMFEVTREARKGKLLTHEVKDLHYIWGKFPDFYNPCNTLHVDDLEQNFAMNPENGLVVTPYNSELRLTGTDDTLLRLSHYLLEISRLPDLTQVNHKNWEAFIPSKIGLSSSSNTSHHHRTPITTTTAALPSNSSSSTTTTTTMTSTSASHTTSSTTATTAVGPTTALITPGNSGSVSQPHHRKQHGHHSQRQPTGAQRYTAAQIPRRSTSQHHTSAHALRTAAFAAPSPTGLTSSSTSTSSTTTTTTAASTTLTTPSAVSPYYIGPDDQLMLSRSQPNLGNGAYHQVRLQDGSTAAIPADLVSTGVLRRAQSDGQSARHQANNGSAIDMRVPRSSTAAANADSSDTRATGHPSGHVVTGVGDVAGSGGEAQAAEKKGKLRSRVGRKLSSLRDRFRSKGRSEGEAYDTLDTVDDTGDHEQAPFTKEQKRKDKKAKKSKKNRHNTVAVTIDPAGRSGDMDEIFQGGGLCYYYEKPVVFGEGQRKPFAWLPSSHRDQTPS